MCNEEQQSTFVVVCPCMPVSFQIHQHKRNIIMPRPARHMQRSECRFITCVAIGTQFNQQIRRVCVPVQASDV